MKIRMTCDIDGTSGVNAVLNQILDFGFDDFTLKNNYGEPIQDVFIVLFCRRPELPFKQRVRMDRKEGKLSMDVMLYLPDLLYKPQAHREKKVIEAILDQIPKAIRKYKFKTFDINRFENDLKSFFSNWIYSEK